jgi:hypothetical protein
MLFYRDERIKFSKNHFQLSAFSRSEGNYLDVVGAIAPVGRLVRHKMNNPGNLS